TKCIHVLPRWMAGTGIVPQDLGDAIEQQRARVVDERAVPDRSVLLWQILTQQSQRDVASAQVRDQRRARRADLGDIPVVADAIAQAVLQSEFLGARIG